MGATETIVVGLGAGGATEAVEVRESINGNSIFSRVSMVINLLGFGLSSFQLAYTSECARFGKPGSSFCGEKGRAILQSDLGRMVDIRYALGLNIKNAEVERLATDVANLAHETKTEAIKRALMERRARLQAQAGTPGNSTGLGLRAYLEHHVWPLIPAAESGRVMSRDEEDTILGYGPDGF